LNTALPPGNRSSFYDFVRGVWSMHLTTRKTEFYVNDTLIYVPASIGRGGILHGEDIGKDSLTITVPVNHDLVCGIFCTRLRRIR